MRLPLIPSASNWQGAAYHHPIFLASTTGKRTVFQLFIVSESISPEVGLRVACLFFLRRSATQRYGSFEIATMGEELFDAPSNFV